MKIRVSDEPVAARQRRSGVPRKLIAGGLLVLVGIGIVLFSSRGEPPRLQDAEQDAEQQKATVLEKADPVVDEPLAQVTTFADDGKSLWVSPTAGEPLDLGYLLPGTQLVLHVRVSELLSHPEGEKVLAALGPWGEQITQRIALRTELALPEIKTLLLGIRLTRDGSLEVAVRFRLDRALSPQEIEQASRTQDSYACFSPEQSAGEVLILCPTAAIAELKSNAGQPPLFARELQRVLQQTDTTRMATLAFAGKFLQISGEKFLSGAGGPLREALIDFLGDEATATAMSLHWDENFFLELLSTVALNERPHRFAALLGQRVAASADRVEDVLLAESPHPYGRKVLARFPAMLRKLGNYTRVGEVEGLCLLRAYLPVRAGHNLVMGAELLVGGGAGLEDGVGGATSRDASGGDLGISVVEALALGQRLQQTTSLVFPKETLQSALEMLAADIGVPLLIAGRDLQLEGITKNQSFAIDLRQKPAAEILLAVLLLANPDKTASGPTDVKQKLVYVLRETEIVVTTRAAAGQRGEKLPAVFVPTAR